MGLNIDQLRLMIYKPLGITPSSAQLPTEQVDLYLNRAFWEVQNKFPFREKEATSIFETVAGTRNYNVQFPTEAIKFISIEYPSTSAYPNQHKPLDQITAFVYEQLYNSDPNNQGMPTKYVREACIIRFYPTPDDVYSIIIRRLVSLNDLSDENTEANIPQVWHEIIGYGGLWRAFGDNGDIQRAEYFHRKQRDLINDIIPTEAQESQANSQHAGLTVLGLEY